MNRSTLTTKAGKAKCLNYRNGKRCGRVAKHEVQFPTILAAVEVWHHVVVCDDCLLALQEEHPETKINATSPKGFTVRETAFGPTRRIYTPIS